MIQSKNKLIKEVIKIILKYAKPERIYLYGSQANGEADNTSDIDIAYDDKDFKDNYLIKEETDKLETLTKIDIQNIAKSDERFRNRVKSTGKVLYSATKRLRAEDALYNFSQALDRFINVVDREQKFKENGLEDVYLDLVVRRFEFTYEMSWKALKRYLDFLGIEATNPRSVFKEAFAHSIISDENIWLDMIEQRNLSSHMYDELEIREILDKKENYKEAFIRLRDNIKQSLLED
jgi:nucleotidyltransferase substrate binding protein (TIGR01987 family)